MKFAFFFATVILIALHQGVNGLCFSSICCCNIVRQTDNCGRGTYGASRSGGRRSHRGIDIICPANSDVRAPFNATIIRTARPYSNNNGRHNTGVLMKGTGKWAAHSVKMFYVRKTVNNGDHVRGGSNIGVMTNMAREYRCTMTNHIHVQLYKNNRIIDPTPYTC
ncbi:leukocyte cell-derived chemotaxin-2-like [Actinia tenebrosa]|uniref:Leukocyte cell-derived chemotaxin-2-like n=1 Tax=Actinia tenebrosa TaxID=6105 RepID=A0A6P8GZ10_ACTTE|nr:leukocyte cell-derived chemotaxin-2-like [Actinia tenebrosa]